MKGGYHCTALPIVQTRLVTFVGRPRMLDEFLDRWSVPYSRGIGAQSFGHCVPVGYESLQHERHIDVDDTKGTKKRVCPWGQQSVERSQQVGGCLGGVGR